jgi:hypothetical protein
MMFNVPMLLYWILAPVQSLVFESDQFKSSESTCVNSGHVNLHLHNACLFGNDSILDEQSGFAKKTFRKSYMISSQSQTASMQTASTVLQTIFKTASRTMQTTLCKLQSTLCIM